MTPPRKGGLALCYGTRPQVVKASVLLDALRRRWHVLAVDTGQHYDFELNGLLYEQLAVPRPDHFLEVGSSAPVQQTADVMTRTAEILRVRQPLAVIVIGDTTSTLGCALAASKEGIPLVHVEAGPALDEAGSAGRRPTSSRGRAVAAPPRPIGRPSRPVSGTERGSRHASSSPGTWRATYWRVISSSRSSPPWTGQPFALANCPPAALTSLSGDGSGIPSGRGLGGLDLPVCRPPLRPPHQGCTPALRAAGRGPADGRTPAPLHWGTEMIAAGGMPGPRPRTSGGVEREAPWPGQIRGATVRGETEWVETVTAGANPSRCRARGA